VGYIGNKTDGYMTDGIAEIQVQKNTNSVDAITQNWGGGLRWGLGGTETGGGGDRQKKN
jgi:hypothetical protein